MSSGKWRPCWPVLSVSTANVLQIYTSVNTIEETLFEHFSTFEHIFTNSWGIQNMFKCVRLFKNVLISRLQGGGVTKSITSTTFPHFSSSPKHTLAIEYHVYIWRVSPLLSCGDTCEIWIWFKESNEYFCRLKKCLQRNLVTTPCAETRVYLTVVYILRKLDMSMLNHYRTQVVNGRLY